jgi:hypothetical protein
MELSRMSDSNVSIFGIRHHGPGSARSLLAALHDLRPDCILIEGPPDAADVLPLAAHLDFRPPVALLVYDPQHPRRAVYYPFAAFSPEWNAIRFGLSRGAAVRFIDLPHSHLFALAAAEEACPGAPEGSAERAEAGADPGEVTQAPADSADALRRDPLHHLALACGDADGERWWDRMIESRRGGSNAAAGGREHHQIFAAVLEAMTALRTDADAHESPSAQNTFSEEVRETLLREAHMRKMIRAALREGFQRIAVVCGAWHAPALATMPAAGHDSDLLKGLPRIKTAATWIPWTHSRLCYDSGYGAGIESPGWYEHLWTCADSITERWMTRIARLLREHDLDASSAQVIDAVRLAETAAALRQRPLPGLDEMTEAVQAVLTGGDALPLRLIHTKLIVGETLGAVPSDAPTIPLQRDLEQQQKSLRLKVTTEEKILDLDLRNTNDLARSHLLHRLCILGIPWGVLEEVRGKTGTFHELWRLKWQPEFALGVIEAGVWGNTVQEAAAALAQHRAATAPDLPALVTLLDHILLAELPQAAERLAQRLANVAAIATDIGHLMDAVPPLARVARYGNVRQTDAAMIASVLDGLVIRICIGLAPACISLNDEAAAQMLGRIASAHEALSTLRKAEHLEQWYESLSRAADSPATTPLLAGRICRLLLDGGRLTADQAGTRLSLALSRASNPAHGAAWIEGFLGSSALVLIHDQALFGVIDAWLSSLTREHFDSVVPILRRSFGAFAAPERRQLGEMVRQTSPHPENPQHKEGTGQQTLRADNFNMERAAAVLPLVSLILDLQPSAPESAA